MTRYEFFRKRIAPVAFLVVVGLIAYDAYDKDRAKRARATIVIDLGSAASHVRTVEAELFVRDDFVTNFQRDLTAKPGPLRFEVHMPEEQGELRIQANLGERTKSLVRKIDVEEGGTTTVSIGSELLR